MSAIYELRRAVKVRLYFSRRLPGEVYPRCSICGRQVTDGEGADMHEVLLTRGDVQGWRAEERLSIYTRANCALVHHGPCHERAATKEGQRLSIQNLLCWEGRERIAKWLTSLPASKQAARDALRLLDCIAQPASPLTQPQQCAAPTLEQRADDIHGGEKDHSNPPTAYSIDMRR